MGIEHIGEFIKTSGEVMVGMTAILVHRRVWKEHKINNKVHREMSREHVIGLLGVSFIIIGYVLKTFI